MKKTTTHEPQGIGGWLILPAIGLIITPIGMGYQFYRDILPALTPATWNTLTNVSSAAYHPFWGPLLVFDVIVSLALIAFTLRLLWLFFRKSFRVPYLFNIWLGLLVVTPVIELFLANQIPAVAAQPTDPESIKNITRSIISASIWIPYFLHSKRVKNTFIS